MSPSQAYATCVEAWVEHASNCATCRPAVEQHRRPSLDWMLNDDDPDDVELCGTGMSLFILAAIDPAGRAGQPGPMAGEARPPVLSPVAIRATAPRGAYRDVR